MSITTTKETKCRVIQIMKDNKYSNKLYYITVLHQLRKSLLRCFEKKKLFKSICSEIGEVKLTASFLNVLAKYT